MAINKLEIDGRLTRDAEVKHTSNGARVIKFSLAQTERKKQGDTWVDDGASFYDVEYWAHDSDDINKFSKGQYISFIGKIKQDRWDDANGQPRSKIKITMKEIVAWEFEKKGGNVQNMSYKPDSGNGANSYQPSNKPSDKFVDDVPWQEPKKPKVYQDDLDIPF